MYRQSFMANAAKTTFNTRSSYCNHAQKQHAALKSKCDKVKGEEVDWSDPAVRAWALGPVSWECVYWAMFMVQYEWVMRVKQERANGHVRLFSRHYLGIPGWDKPEFTYRPAVQYVQEAESTSLPAKAVVPKPALAIPHSNPKPVQQAADSSCVKRVTISNTLTADQQAATQQAEALIASDPVSSNTTQQQACSSGSNSTSAVLPSSDIVCPKNTVKSTTTFVTKVLDCFHSFMALELEFDVTIGYWS